MDFRNIHQYNMPALASCRRSFAVFTLFLVLSCFQYQYEAVVLEEEFSGKIVTELKVNLPAEEVWDVYRSKKFGKLLPKLNPQVKSVDFVTGDGGVGTLFNITTQPGVAEVGGGSRLEEIIQIDDKTMTRVMRHVQGVYRDAGFTLLLTESRIIKKEKNSCIIKFTLPFKIKQESLSNASLIRPSWIPGTLIVDYINSMKSAPLVLRKEFRGEIVTEMKVNLPADEIWDVYRSKEFGHLLLKLSPSYFKQIDYIKGDGGLGTVLNITIQPAFGGSNWIDQIIVLDDRTKTRLLRHVKGGMLDVGFTEFAGGYRIIKKVHKSCVIRAFSPFKIGAESVSNASVLQPSWGTAMTIANYVNSRKV